MLVGRGIDRRDGRLKVTGRAKYAAEFAIPGAVSAMLVQSTIGTGQIESFDLSAAQGMPGVLAIITPDNAERLNIAQGAQQTVEHPLLQTRDIWYQGQHVAVVVADTLDRASAAAAAVRVKYREGEPVSILQQAMNQQYTPKHFRNGEAPPDTTTGNPAGAFSGAATRFDATYTTPVEHHNPMEPHATIARWNGDKLTVWTSTQGISGAQRTLATLFKLPVENVTVICPFVGGGFGTKGNTWPPVTLAAMAARRVGRPVRLVLTREQMFTSNGYRPATVQKVQLGAEADGKLTSLRHDGVSQMSLPVLGEYAEGMAMAARMLYATPNLGTTHRLASVNQGLPTYMRAPGEAPGMFALECAMDELAVALEIDPVELRLRNYADRDPTDNKPFASKGLRACYEQGAAAFGWAQRNPQPRSMRDGRLLIGQGFATSTYPTNRQPASARVRLMPDGSALVQAGSQDIGTGTYTIAAQVAADELGLPVQRIRVELGDSRFPPAPVSGGSQTAASLLPAVQAAARNAKLQALTLAATQMGDVQPGDVRLRNGVFVGPTQRIAMAALLSGRKMPYVEGMASAKIGDDAKDYSRHAFGAQFAEVAVDPDLGTIRVRRWVGAFDCGKVINPKTTRSQLIGGITFGIGMALLEETRVDVDSARYTNANISEYLVPVNADIPDIKTITVEADDTITDPLGLKGVGELPMVGAAPAVANAVYHATGVRVRNLPIRIEDVLA